MDNSRFTGMLDELLNMLPEKDKHLIIENRAKNVIASALHLFQSIEENFTLEEAEELEKRLLSAIKNRDENKFIRKVRQLKEGKKDE